MADIKIAGRIKAGTADNIAGYASEILFDDEASNKTVKEKLEGKQDTLTFDNVPTKGSNNPVKSGGVYQAIQDIDVSSQISGKADKSEMSVVAGTGANADKTTITLKSGTSATVLTQHQDVSEFLREGEVFGSGGDSAASFNSYADTVWNKQQTLSESQKQQVRENIGIADLETIRNGAAAGATAIQSVTVGTTTTGAAGSSASVVNSGTATAPVLDFTIPQGAQGVKGDTVIMGNEDTYTLYNTTGDAVDGAMTQQAVTRELAELSGGLHKFIGLTASITIPAALPAGYTVLDYIANTSSSGGYIDTGILPNDSNWTFEGSWMLTGAIETYQAIMASYSTETANSYRVIYNNTSTTAVLINANTKASAPTTSSVNGANEWNTFSIQYGTATINGTVVSLGTTAGTVITNNMCLFSNTAATKFLVGKMRRFKAWHNGTLVRDMIPCINPQSVYGMYDIVNDVFYGSSNANSFTGGN